MYCYYFLNQFIKFINNSIIKNNYSLKYKLTSTVFNLKIVEVFIKYKKL